MKKTHLFVLISLLSFVDCALAQPSSDDIGAAGDAFTFVRVQYDNAGGGWGGGLGFGGGWGRRGGRGTWSIDYPDADFNFLRGVTRLTNIHINSSPTVLRLDDVQQPSTVQTFSSWINRVDS